MLRDHSGWFFEVFGLIGMPSLPGAVVSSARLTRNPEWRQCFTGDTTARSSPWQYGRGRMVVGKQSCAKSWRSSTTTAATSPAPTIACCAASLRPKSSRKCCALPIPTSKRFLAQPLSILTHSKICARSTNTKTSRLKATETLNQCGNAACMREAVDGPGDRDTALPHRDGDHRCYCWPRATEIAVLPGKRVDGQVSEPGCDCNSDAHSC